MGPGQSVPQKYIEEREEGSESLVRRFGLLRLGHWLLWFDGRADKRITGGGGLRRASLKINRQANKEGMTLFYACSRMDIGQLTMIFFSHFRLTFDFECVEEHLYLTYLWEE
jgi:hypothetical protein